MNQNILVQPEITLPLTFNLPPIVIHNNIENNPDDNTENDSAVDKKDEKTKEEKSKEEKSKRKKNTLIEKINKVPMSKLMEVLDGYDTFHGCIIILTTNHKEYLDNALIRPGRVDMHYFFGPLNSGEIKTTIKRFTGFDIAVPSDLSMTSSTLINQILLPNRRDRLGIKELIQSSQ